MFLIPVHAEDLSFDDVKEQLVNELGEKDAKELLNELQQMSELTRDKVTEKCAEYGVMLSDVQLDVMLDDFKDWGKSSGFFDSIAKLWNRFWAWIKQLGRDSTVEVSKPEKDQPLIKKDGDKVTITIPKTSDVDKVVDNIIDKVKDYIITTDEE